MYALGDHRAWSDPNYEVWQKGMLKAVAARTTSLTRILIKIICVRYANRHFNAILTIRRWI